MQHRGMQRSRLSLCLRNFLPNARLRMPGEVPAEDTAEAAEEAEPAQEAEAEEAEPAQEAEAEEAQAAPAEESEEAVGGRARGCRRSPGGGYCRSCGRGRPNGRTQGINEAP